MENSRSAISALFWDVVAEFSLNLTTGLVPGIGFPFNLCIALTAASSVTNDTKQYPAGSFVNFYRMMKIEIRVNSTLICWKQLTFFINLTVKGSSPTLRYAAKMKVSVMYGCEGIEKNVNKICFLNDSNEIDNFLFTCRLPIHSWHCWAMMQCWINRDSA